MKFIKLLFLIVLLKTIQSCKKENECITEIKFDKNLWAKNQVSDCYRDREKMVNNLLDSHKIKGLKYSEIAKLLGETEIESTSHTKSITYIITTKNDSTIESKYYKNLIISLDKDSIAQSIMLTKMEK